MIICIGNGESRKDFDLNKLSGKKILLSFYRFAACPMCNLRLNEINKVYGDLQNFLPLQ